MQPIKQGITSMSSGDTFNFGGVSQTSTGAGSVNQIGQNTATINNTGEKPPTVENVFKTILEAVPEDKQAEIEEQVFGPLKAELQALSASPIAEVQEPVPTCVERIATLVAPLAPYSDKIASAVLSFSEASLSMIAPPAGWFVAATLAAIRSLKGSAV